MTVHDFLIVGLALLANVAYIGLRALQQRNVIHENFLALWPTSMLMAVGDWFNPALVTVYTVEARASGDWTMPCAIILAWGIGGALGSRTAIEVHKRYHK